MLLRATLFLSALLVGLATQAAEVNTFFEQPISKIGPALLRAAGCSHVYSYADGSPPTKLCMCDDKDGGLPGTVRLNIFDTDGIKSEGQKHVFFQWTDFPPGSILPAHTEKEQARLVARNLMDAIVLLHPEIVEAVLFARMPQRNRVRFTRLSEPGIRIVVELEDSDGVTTGRLFIGGNALDLAP